MDDKPARRPRVDRHARKNHPFVTRLRAIREGHGATLVAVEACMGLPFGTLRHIEEGVRPPPGIYDIGAWLRSWMACVRVSDAERAEIEELLMQLIIDAVRDNQ